MRCANAGRRSSHSLSSPPLSFPRHQDPREPAILGVQPAHFLGQGLQSRWVPTLARFSPLLLLPELLEARLGSPTLLFPLIPTLDKKRHQLSLRALLPLALRSGAERRCTLRLLRHTALLLSGYFSPLTPLPQDPLSWPSLPSAEQNWSPSPPSASSPRSYTFTWAGVG